MSRNKKPNAAQHADSIWMERSPSPEAEIVPPEYSEDALAIQFMRRHGADLRYVKLWNRWLFWNGNYWKKDATDCVSDRARLICREAAANATNADKSIRNMRLAEHLASARTISAVLKIAGTDRALAATADQWDTDLWLLNTPKGMVDLRTGELRLHDRLAYCTKITSVSPADPGAQCPIWMQFLSRITDGNREIEQYLQRVSGYCLTGITREHVLFFVYGTGRNGKGSFLNTISFILNSYATTASTDILMASQNMQHPTGLANLCGARLVVAQETEQGNRWAEARIKTLTGGDIISARFMRGDFFSFTPQFKLCIAANHKPSLRNVDEAISARLHLIPFSVTIPPEERDMSLMEKLREEAPAILRWMIEGCIAWQREKLNPPEAVNSATQDYLSDEDSMGQWLSDYCEKINGRFELTSKLFESWTQWAEQSGEYAGTKRRLSDYLKAHGFELKRSAGGQRGFSGIRLKGEADC